MMPFANTVAARLIPKTHCVGVHPQPSRILKLKAGWLDEALEWRFDRTLSPPKRSVVVVEIQISLSFCFLHLAFLCPCSPSSIPVVTSEIVSPVFSNLFDHRLRQSSHVGLVAAISDESMHRAGEIVGGCGCCAHSSKTMPIPICIALGAILSTDSKFRRQSQKLRSSTSVSFSLWIFAGSVRKSADLKSKGVGPQAM